MHARNIVVGALLGAVVGLTGCASKTEEPAAGPTPSGTTSGQTSSTHGSSHGSTPTELPDDAIEVTISGDDVTPSGKQVDVSRGEDVVFRITSDAPGELHFHSTPEQSIEFAAGTSTHTVRFERPGVVEVESHELAKVVVQLEVR